MTCIDHPDKPAKFILTYCFGEQHKSSTSLVYACSLECLRNQTDPNNAKGMTPIINEYVGMFEN